jgi:hypothetical protein
MKYKLLIPNPPLAPTPDEERLKHYLIEDLKKKDFKTNGDVLNHLEERIRFMGMGKSHIAMISNKELLRIYRLSFMKTANLFDFKLIEEEK